ncbi:hypothetical protein EMCRGX_G030598 [Ephydatia muelleri]
MATSIGKIGEFDGATEDWCSYTERLEHFFKANKVGDEEKNDAFLSCIGKETSGLLRLLLAPAKPKDKTYEEMVLECKTKLFVKPELSGDEHVGKDEESEDEDNYSDGIEVD